MATERTRSESLQGTDALMIALDSDNHMASGTIALDGSNPTPIVTGLASIDGSSVTLQGSSAPGLGTSVVTHTISGGTINVHAWKVTGAGDATLIASTGTETVAWTAKGKK